jgi:hypothetical protein
MERRNIERDRRRKRGREEEREGGREETYICVTMYPQYNNNNKKNKRNILVHKQKNGWIYSIGVMGKAVKAFLQPEQHS